MFKDIQQGSAKAPSVNRRSDSEHLRILRIPAVIRRVGLSRSSIYNLRRSGDFPCAVKLGARTVGFVEQEIDKWLCDACKRRQGNNA